jgi:hypothetical protein
MRTPSRENHRASLLVFAVVAIIALARCSSSSTSGMDASVGLDAADNFDGASPRDAAGDAGATTDGGTPDSGLDLTGPFLDKDCDPIAPDRCGFPFPSNAYTKADPSTPTGRRINFGPTTLPVPQPGTRHLDPSVWNDGDGFSPGATIMTFLPGATIRGLPTKHDIQTSLTSTSPTIVLDADTGARIPHFAELDMSTSTASKRLLLIHPVVRLENATRYIVAIRHVVDAAGAEVPPSPVFAALKSGGSSAEQSVALRRDLYTDIFARLARAQVAKDDLQIAWDFTVASDENLTGSMIAMRDLAYQSAGQEGPPYAITEVTDNPNLHTARRIRGMMTVPLYLDRPDPGGKLFLGPDGKPAQNGTADFPFTVIIPRSATTGVSRAVLQNGHGLLSEHEEGMDSYLAELADQKGYVVFSVDWIGLAENDSNYIAGTVLQDMAKFRSVTDRLHQALVNALLAMRMMKGRFAREPMAMFGGASAIDPTHAYYRGDSQGGIMGVPYLALSEDVPRGLLGEAGMAYGLMLNRSVDFAPFFQVLNLVYPDPRDVQLVIALTQMQWDRAEGTGYANHVTANPFPSTPPKQALIHAAIGDFQVTTLASELLARSIGAKLMKPVVRHVFGLEEVDSPFMGSALVEWDFHLSEPETNVPPDGPSSDDPHDKVRKLQASHDQTDTFLRTGVVDMAPCLGVCSAM